MTIYHIVLVKYKPETTSEQRASWMSAMRALLHSVPQMKELKSGPKIPREADGGWEDGVISVFENRGDLDAYAVSEPHVAFLNFVLPFVADKLIYDIDVEA